MDKRIIAKYSHFLNVNLKDSIIKGKNNQRFYRVTCSKCNGDRGYIEPREFIKLCLSCTKTKHSVDLRNINYDDFIKETGKPTRYRMRCLECDGDKGYKQIACWNRRCFNCSNKHISKIKTKLTPQHKKVRHSFSVCVSSRLKNRGSSKFGNSTFAVLGYSFNDLIRHLESQFEPWMNWDNYGIYNSAKQTWNIDHIIPDSSFLYENIHDEGFYQSWKLSNLRPLEAKQNIIKGSKI